MASQQQCRLSRIQIVVPNVACWPIAAIAQNNNHMHWQLINSPAPSIRRICAALPSPPPYPKRPVPTSPPPPALLYPYVIAQARAFTGIQNMPPSLAQTHRINERGPRVLTHP